MALAIAVNQRSPNGVCCVKCTQLLFVHWLSMRRKNTRTCQLGKNKDKTHNSDRKKFSHAYQVLYGTDTRPLPLRVRWQFFSIFFQFVLPKWRKFNHTASKYVILQTKEARAVVGNIFVLDAWRKSWYLFAVSSSTNNNSLRQMLRCQIALFLKFIKFSSIVCRSHYPQCIHIHAQRSSSLFHTHAD